jgi:hypothetical protein
MARIKVCYRVNNGACQTGFQLVNCDPTTAPVYKTSADADLTPVANAAVVPCTSCPVEVTAVPQPPIVVPATACGGDTTVYASSTLSQVVHTAPGTALLVKICRENQRFDREMLQLCTPDGTKVFVQNVTPDNAVLGSAPIFEAWTITGARYTGALASLVDCGGDKVNTEHSDYCLAGVNYTRVDGLAENTGAPIWSVWLNDAGVLVSAPIGATKGVCGKCKPINTSSATTSWGF